MRKDDEAPVRIRRTGRANSGKAFAARQRRRDEADARDESYRRLTREEKLERLDARPGFSDRERARIG